MSQLESFLQFLNLPILGGVVVIIYQAGKLVRQLEDHERRISELEDVLPIRRRAPASGPAGTRG